MIRLVEDVLELFFGNKRISELKHFGNQKSFQFRRRVPMSSLSDDAATFTIFTQNPMARIEGLLYQKEEKNNLTSYIFDLYHKVDYRAGTTTIFLYLCPKLSMPQFSIKPRTGLGKLGSILKSGEWAHLSKDFDRMFDVTSTDMNFMRSHITIQFAEIMERYPDFIIEGKGQYMTIYKRGKAVDIIDMDNVVSDGQELIDILVN